MKQLTEGQIRYRKYRETYKLYGQTHTFRKQTPEENKSYSSNRRFGGLKNIVLERDNNKCVVCGMTNEEHIKKWGRDITVDHIDGSGRYSNKHNNLLENLRTLCLSCHGRYDALRRFHSDANIIFLQGQM
jgi:predicted HNH restriction endonuclease